MCVQVKFTEAEYQATALRAAAARLSVPSYLAVSGLRPEGVAAVEAKSAVTNLVATRRALAGAANNLNQLTAKLHATGEFDETLPAAVRAVERFAARVDDVVAQVSAVVDGRGGRTGRTRA